ncbi:putative MFS glucose transporter [Tuber brumale]|nr:putative MFS glucose transporter [Tuber brumale]
MIALYTYTCFPLFVECTKASESSPVQLLVDPSGSFLTAIPPLFIPVPSAPQFHRSSFRFLLHRCSTALHSGSFFAAVLPLFIPVELSAGSHPTPYKGEITWTEFRSPAPRPNWLLRSTRFKTPGVLLLPNSFSQHLRATSNPLVYSKADRFSELISVACVGYSLSESNNALSVGLATTIFPIGGLFGSMIATPAVNTVGHKMFLISTASVFTLAGFLKTGAGGPTIFITGFYSSTAVIVPIYINELEPARSKGAFSNLYCGDLTQISLDMGILSSQVLGIYLGIDEDWCIILLVGGVIGLIQAVGLLFLPESPSSLVAAGDIEGARHVLIKVCGTDDMEQELEVITLPQDVKPIGFMKPVAPQSRSSWATCWPILGPHPPGLPLVLSPHKKLGSNAVVSHGSILDDLLRDSALYLKAAISAVNLFVILVTSFLFDRVRHELLLIISIVSMTIFLPSMTCIGFGMVTLSATATLLFVSFFPMGLGTLPGMVASHKIQPNGVAAAQ